MDGVWVWVLKSEGVGLIVRTISFQDFLTMWSWSSDPPTSQTGRQADRQTDTTQSQYRAMHYSASRGKNNKNRTQTATNWIYSTKHQTTMNKLSIRQGNSYKNVHAAWKKMLVTPWNAQIMSISTQNWQCNIGQGICGTMAVWTNMLHNLSHSHEIRTDACLLAAYYATQIQCWYLY